MAGECWRNGMLGDIAEIKTGKLDSNAATAGGRYPFFTCSPETLTIESAAFDCEAAILAGNNASGIFSVKYFHGKFNAYQRTYIITSRDDQMVDTKYLYYQLQQLTDLLGEYSIGTATKFLTRKILDPLPIPLPPLAEQKAIAHILGVLDDKIELNRRMNATLETMARALFQSWFVDFDPVRAKLDGRQPAGLDADTAALFPDHFQDSPLGHIPHGWMAGNLGNVITAARERIGDTDAVVLSAVSRSELARSDEHFNKQVYSKSISNYLAVRRWDFAYNPSRINIGSVGMLKEDLVGAVSPVYEVFRPTAGFHWFVERVLAQPETKGWIKTLCSGSVRQSLKLKDLSSIQCIIPPLPIVKAFNREWERLYSLIQANTAQSRTLATIRDALLPKLLSGELNIAGQQQAHL